MHEFLLISKYLCDFSIAIIEFHLSAILLKVVIYVIIMFILIFFCFNFNFSFLQIKDGFESGKDLVVSVQCAMGEEQINALKDIGPK